MDQQLSAPEFLPWERPQDNAQGVGVCLSGGGLRAASFSLGVLQVLQDKRGLLYGPKCAEHLSAVSGGSYIASAYVVNGVRLAADPARTSTIAPFSAGTPEERHILANGRYLVRPYTERIWRALLGVVSGPVTLFAMLIWVGFLLADLAVVLLLGASALGIPTWASGWSVWLSAPLAAAALVLIGRSLFAETMARAWAWLIPGLVLTVVVLPAAMESLFAVESLHTPNGWVLPLSVCAGLVAFTALGAMMSGDSRGAARVLGLAERVAVQLLVLVFIGAAATLFLPLVIRVFTDSWITSDVAWFIVALVAPVVAAALLRRTSLHQFYREGLRSTFGVVRDGVDRVIVPQVAPTLSELQAANVPRLLISATANVRFRDPAGRTRTFAPFVFSHDSCGVPSSHMFFDTVQLERVGSDAYLAMGLEPAVTLPTAVAATGAAVSASMGRHTRPSRRLILALFNIRLGRTVPNASWVSRRRQVEQLTSLRRVKSRTAFLPGIDDLIAELVGMSGPNMYISDGGHYDNLGLMTLLRARCQTIWCVDSSPDGFGDAGELRRIVALAETELGCVVALELDRFKTAQRGVYPVTHTSGAITYADGSKGEIHVIKLGFCSGTPADFTEYQRQDPKFPHHSTLNQLYSEKRIAAYRDLGRDNAARCLASIVDERTDVH